MSERRQVKLDFTLVGKTNASWLFLKDFKNSEILEGVKGQVRDQFGATRSVYVFDENLVNTSGRKYPDFYAAGWFTSSEPLIDTKGKGSELVVIAHGENMKEARERMLKAVENSNWEDLARNI